MPDLIYPRSKDGKSIEFYAVIQEKIVQLPDGSLLKMEKIEHSFPIPDSLAWRFLVFLVSTLEGRFHQL